MKILFDIAHPADVHTYRHVRTKLISHGHEVVFMARDKDVVLQLLDAYRIPYEKGTKAKKGVISLSFELIRWFFNAFSLIRKQKIDLTVSLSSPSTAWAAKLNGIPHIMFNDTETGVAQLRMARPATKHIYTPDCLQADWGPKQVRYKGIHDLAYLRPEYFRRQRPEPRDQRSEIGSQTSEVKDKNLEGMENIEHPTLNIQHRINKEKKNRVSNQNEMKNSSSLNLEFQNFRTPELPYAIIRFVSWGASHDRGMKKTTVGFQKRICETISEKMDVYISAEGELPDQLEQFRVDIPPHLLHDAMANAQLVVGDGATTATEAAVMGVPSLYISPFADSLGYCLLLKEYKLLDSVKDEEEGISKIKELLEKPEFEERKIRRQRFLDENIDLVEFITEKIEENF